MSLDHAILGFLASEPMTGYDLKTRRFHGDAAAFWTADQAQVYRTLDRLESAGLVTSKLVPQPGKPDRKVFSLTSAGRKALTEWLETPHPLQPLRDPLLLQLFFSAALTDEALLAVLASARDSYQRRLEGLRKASPGGKGTRTKDDSRQTAVKGMTLAGAMAQARAAIDWIDDCMERIGSGLPVNGLPPAKVTD
jgi:PadR family transcriptional regulator AphA